jgi:hypothetical protein
MVEGADEAVEMLLFLREEISSFTEGGASLSAEEGCQHFVGDKELGSARTV